MAKGILTRRGGGKGEPTPSPSINFVSATGTSITFTITNNSIRDRDITYGLTTPPNTTTINIAANSTSAEQTISGLDPSTTYIIYAQAEDSIIVQVSVETAFEPIQATGGTITDIEIAGIDYRVHSFTSAGTSTFEVTSLGGSDGEVEYLIVAGGGPGGAGNQNEGGGGGGAGGLIQDSRIIDIQNYQIIIGNGGPGITNTGANSTNGQNSSAFGVIALGGGAGGSCSASSGNSGGSGGGGGGCGSGKPGGSGLQSTSASGGFGNNGGLGQ
jgi:hypothetical protein